MGYCTWAGMNEANRTYHDTEWGIPVHDDRHMFEHLTLECLQCGLSWDLMLKKREIFRKCFDNFDYDKIAAYDDADVERILNIEGMIRSPRKVQAVINNARCYQKIREEFGSFCDYIWAYTGNKTILYQGHMTYEEAIQMILPGRYRHFKGNEYEVIGLARHSETMEPMVVYRALYGEGGLWTRPAAIWYETVTRDGKSHKRFERIG